MSTVAAAQATLMVASPRIADVAPACGGELDGFQKLSPAKQRAKLGCLVREISKTLNRKLPTRVDFTTIFERTTATGTTMTYHFRADVYLSEVEPGAMDAWKPQVRDKICADPAMQEIISLGGSYRYVWRDRRRRYIDTLIVRDCPA